MKIKVDENLPVSLAATLRDSGHDAHSVTEENLGGATDPELLAHANAEERLVFTLDRGFGDIRSYPPGTHAGIVIFRLDNEGAAAANDAVRKLVDNHDLDELRGSITIVQHGTLRIRR